MSHTVNPGAGQVGWNDWIRMDRRDRLWPWAMVAPTLLFLVGVIIAPVIFLVSTALYRHMLFQVTPPQFVGLDNFYYLFRSARFQTAVVRMFA